MEELLNKLIEKGWKPFGIKSDNMCLYCLSDNKIVISYYDFDTEWECNHEDKWCDLRQITSIESWLWQFCVENNLVNKYADLWSDVEEAYIWKWKSWLDAIDINWDYIRLDDDYDEYHQDTDYKYWLIESALKDESDLEKFLLDNIKVS